MISENAATFASASNPAGQTHAYVARYSPISGRVQVWRDGVRLGGWVDSQATWTQRMTGINWAVPGLGSGSDYAATGDTSPVLVMAEAGSK